MKPNDGCELRALWDAIVEHTKGDMFWIGEILLSELTKETGYSKPLPAELLAALSKDAHS